MSEYEMIAFRDDRAEPVESMLFGSRPADEWVHKLADKGVLGIFGRKTNFPAQGIDIRLQFENGHIDIIKHTPRKKD